MINEYFRLKTEELLNELQQVKSFIKKHNPTIGILTEEILRKFLATYLPKGISVEQGFVINEEGVLSKQIDILIYDSNLYAPFYRINDIVVVPNKSVIAIVEVKTTVNSKSAFHEIIDYFNSVAQILRYDTTKYLFIYNSASVGQLSHYFDNYNHPGEYQEFDHDTFQYLPDVMVGINSSYFLCKDYVISEGDMKGYTSYNYLDNTNKDISSLELFYKDIYENVFGYLSKKASEEFNRTSHFSLKSDKTLKSFFAIELFNI